MSAVITGVEAGSLAEKYGIEPGSTLLKINGHDIVDVLDYRFYMVEDVLKVAYKTPSGKFMLQKIVKDDEYDDLGLEFETYLIDKQHSCNNKCIFCFVDQLPEGMRDSLYFKDDDSRMSFFYGNYVTLTNLKQEDIDRIIAMHISPINVSVHTMNPELRCEMMNNRFAGESLEYLKQLADAGIAINAQLVLCPGINDGEELCKSVAALYKLSPALQSVACVPVGLTKYREGLPELRMFTKEEARKTVALIDGLASYIKPKLGKRFCYAADEFYLLGEMPIPDEDYYDDYPQLDNGVGLLRLMETEVKEAAEKRAEDLKYFDVRDYKKKRLTIVTGMAALPMIGKLSCTVEGLYGSALKLNVLGIKNNFFGHNITVSGLITGGDIMAQLEGKDLGKAVFIPETMLRAGDETFLDDVTVSDLEKKFNVPFIVVSNDGYDFVDKICNKFEEVE